MEEHKRIAERERGNLAKNIIDSPIWDESWQQFEDSLIGGWRMTRTGEAERREMIYAQIRAAEFARKHIEEIFRTGKLAEMQLDEERS